MIDFHMRQHHRRVYGARASKEIRDATRASPSRTTRTPTTSRTSATRSAATWTPTASRGRSVVSRSNAMQRGLSSFDLRAKNASSLLPRSLHTSLTELNSVASKQSVASRIDSFLGIVQKCEKKQKNVKNCSTNSKNHSRNNEIASRKPKFAPNSHYSPLIKSHARSTNNVNEVAIPSSSKMERIKSRLLSCRDYQPPRRASRNANKETIGTTENHENPENLENPEYDDDFEEEDESHQKSSIKAKNNNTTSNKALDKWLSDQATRTEARRMIVQHQREQESSLDSACALSGPESRFITRESTPDSARNALYLKFVNNVSKQILSRGLFSDRIVNQVIRQEAKAQSGLLSRREIDLLVSTLKCEFGLDTNNNKSLTKKGLGEVLFGHKNKGGYDKINNDGIDDVADIIANLSLGQRERQQFEFLRNQQHRRKKPLMGADLSHMDVSFSMPKYRRESRRRRSSQPQSSETPDSLYQDDDEEEQRH